MARAKKPINRTTFVKKILRRASLRWPPRNQAYKNARVDRGRYRCAMCEDVFGPNDVQMDHVQPAVDVVDGYQDLNTYAERMLPYEDGWQCLCRNCHESKTLIENNMRTNVAEINYMKEKEAKRVETERKKMKKLIKTIDKNKRSGKVK